MTTPGPRAIERGDDAPDATGGSVRILNLILVETRALHRKRGIAPGIARQPEPELGVETSYRLFAQIEIGLVDVDDLSSRRPRRSIRRRQWGAGDKARKQRLVDDKRFWGDSENDRVLQIDCKPVDAERYVLGRLGEESPRKVT